MNSPPALLRRHFLPWDRPLLPQAVAFLAGDWDGRGPLDLSRILVVVPTRHAGRRLREALAVRAAERRQAVFAPQVLTADRVADPGAAAGVASPLESLMAWVTVLMEIDLAGCREVIPIDPPQRNLGWALGLARSLMKLQRELAEGGLRVRDVLARLGELPEGGRWQQLGALEAVHAARLSQGGLVDAPAAKLTAARQASVPNGIARIVVVGTPDPPRLAVEALAVLARAIPVDVVVHAPPVEAGGFDEWGRPQVNAWSRRILAWSDFESCVHLCADAAAQAERRVAVAADYSDAPDQLALGVADPAALPAVESALRHSRIAVFNPEGKRRRQDGFYHLLVALAGLARSPEFASVAGLARCPEVLRWLRARRGPDFSVERWLAGLDWLHARHLPTDLAAALGWARAARDFPQLAEELELVGQLHAVLRRGTFAESVCAVLTELFTREEATRDASWTENAEAWMEVVRGCDRAERRGPSFTRGDWWQLALGVFGDLRETEEKPVGARELLGWLELPWEDAPHLVVAGLNEGCVPEAIPPDAFLPGALRERLGLETSETRRARDAFLLQALAAARAETGRLDLLLGKFSSAGEPLRPSRLLLSCADEELPRRIRFLFRTPPLAQTTLAWQRAWTLALPRRSPPSRVAVTALKGWLRCPLRHYLRHVLGMEAVDPMKSELDAFDFGTLCHGALEALARDPAARDSRDIGAVRAFLLGELDRRMRQRYGSDLALPLLVQLESARQRLGKAAEIQVRERAAGWAIAEAERKFELEVDGIVIVGKIDRIERHELTGAWRVLDYKTSDTAVNPESAHLRGLRRGEQVEDWMRWSGDGGRPRVWCDLQLPIYRQVLAAETRGAPVDCAYFNLPKATAGTEIQLWADYTPELQAAAWSCLRGVVAAIRAGRFWPPMELRGREAELDEFAALFHGTAASSVRWEDEA